MWRFTSQPRASVRPLLVAVSKLVLLIFALGITWYAGHRGIFFVDQSTIFDGGWRVLQGQVPYRDFYMTFGPFAFWVQAAFFKLCGVNFSSMVLGGAVVNVLATACVMRTAMILTGSIYSALIGGFVTAIWFQPPYGTLSVEQTAFLFACLALQCLQLPVDHPLPLQVGEFRLQGGGFVEVRFPGQFVNASAQAIFQAVEPR